MAGILTAALLLVVALRVFGQGQEIDWAEVVGLPQLLALVASLSLLVWLLLHRSSGDAVVAAAALDVCGLLLVLFPERMPDTPRGGTLMTAFWALFGGVLIGLAALIALLARPTP